VIQSNLKNVCFILKRKKGVGFCLFWGKKEILWMFDGIKSGIPLVCCSRHVSVNKSFLTVKEKSQLDFRLYMNGLGPSISISISPS
jgi:hypothetical protein